MDPQPAIDIFPTIRHPAPGRERAFHELHKHIQVLADAMMQTYFGSSEGISVGKPTQKHHSIREHLAVLALDPAARRLAQIQEQTHKYFQTAHQINIADLRQETRDGIVVRVIGSGDKQSQKVAQSILGGFCGKTDIRLPSEISPAVEVLGGGAAVVLDFSSAFSGNNKADAAQFLVNYLGIHCQNGRGEMIDTVDPLVAISHINGVTISDANKRPDFARSFSCPVIFVLRNDGFVRRHEVREATLSLTRSVLDQQVVKRRGKANKPEKATIHVPSFENLTPRHVGNMLAMDDRAFLERYGRAKTDFINELEKMDSDALAWTVVSHAVTELAATADGIAMACQNKPEDTADRIRALSLTDMGFLPADYLAASGIREGVGNNHMGKVFDAYARSISFMQILRDSLADSVQNKTLSPSEISSHLLIYAPYPAALLAQRESGGRSSALTQKELQAFVAGCGLVSKADSAIHVSADNLEVKFIHDERTIALGEFVSFDTAVPIGKTVCKDAVLLQYIGDGNTMNAASVSVAVQKNTQRYPDHWFVHPIDAAGNVHSNIGIFVDKVSGQFNSALIDGKLVRFADLQNILNQSSFYRFHVKEILAPAAIGGQRVYSVIRNVFSANRSIMASFPPTMDTIDHRIAAMRHVLFSIANDKNLNPRDTLMGYLGKNIAVSSDRSVLVPFRQYLKNANAEVARIAGEPRNHLNITSLHQHITELFDNLEHDVVRFMDDTIDAEIASVRARAHSEAHNAARLGQDPQKTRIVPIVSSSFAFRLGEDLTDSRSQRVFLVSPYLENVSDGDACIGSPLLNTASLHQVAYDMATACFTLEQARLVNRDVKPANVLIQTDPLGQKITGAYMVDLGTAVPIGISTKAEVSTRGAGATEGIGTMEFASIQQIAASSDGSILTATDWDVFGYGAALFTLATGQKADKININSNHQALEGVAFLQSNVPLKHLILRCLDSDSRNRPQSFAEIKSALSAISSRHDTRNVMPGRSLAEFETAGPKDIQTLFQSILLPDDDRRNAAIALAEKMSQIDVSGKTNRAAILGDIANNMAHGKNSKFDDRSGSIKEDTEITTEAEESAIVLYLRVARGLLRAQPIRGDVRFFKSVFYSINDSISSKEDFLKFHGYKQLAAFLRMRNPDGSCPCTDSDLIQILSKDPKHNDDTSYGLFQMIALAEAHRRLLRSAEANAIAPASLIFGSSTQPNWSNFTKNPLWMMFSTAHAIPQSTKTKNEKNIWHDLHTSLPGLPAERQKDPDFMTDDDVSHAVAAAFLTSGLLNQSSADMVSTISRQYQSLPIHRSFSETVGYVDRFRDQVVKHLDWIDRATDICDKMTLHRSMLSTVVDQGVSVYAAAVIEQLRKWDYENSWRPLEENGSLDPPEPASGFLGQETSAHKRWRAGRNEIFSIARNIDYKFSLRIQNILKYK